MFNIYYTIFADTDKINFSFVILKIKIHFCTRDII